MPVCLPRLETSQNASAWEMTRTLQAIRWVCVCHTNCGPHIVLTAASSHYMQILSTRGGRDVAYSVGGTVADLVGQLLLGTLLARALGPSGVAAYYVGTTIGALLLGPLSPGMAALVPREVASGRATLGAIMGAVLSLRALVTLPVSALLLVPLLFLAAPEYRTAILVGYGLVASQHLILTLQSSMEAQHRFDRKVWTILLYRSAVVGSAAICLMIRLAPTAVLVAQLFVTAIVLVVVAAGVKAHIPDLDFRGGIRWWPAVIRRGYPILLTSMLFLLSTRLDTLILAAFVPASEVGLYSTSTLVITAAAAPSLAVIIGAFPTLVARLASGNGRGLAIRVLLLVAGYCLAATPVLIVLGPALLMVLFGMGYEPAAPLLSVLAVSLIPMAMNRSALYYLIATDRAAWAWLSSAAGLVIATVLNLVLIPRLGAMGAAINSIAGETAVLIVGAMAIRFVQRRQIEK